MQSRSLIFGLPLAAGLLFAVAPSFQETKLDHAKLKTLVSGLGYEVKDLSESKLEFTVKTEGLNIPLGAEISPSGRYIWLTAFLGPSGPGTELDKVSGQLLRANGKVQPTFFYVTSKDNLMAAFATENRNVEASHLKLAIDKLSKDLDSTRDIWLIKD